MRRWGFVLLAVALLGAVPVARAGDAAPAHRAAIDPLLEQALDLAAPGEEVVAIANLHAPAGSATVDSLVEAGVRVHAYRHLPMAGVIGTVDAIDRVAALPMVTALYWDEPQPYDLKESQEAISAAEAWDLGYHGEGVGIAILDSGVDGTHPDLADHMAANVKILGPGYLDQPRSTFDETFIEDVPTSDTTSGHGTHVAGDAAGDGTASGGTHRGPAFEADIIGLGAGEGLRIYTALAGFDWVLENHEEHNIRVVNNSWGSSFRLVDPEHPIVQASRLVTEAGITVVFSAGNRYEEMTISPYAAPWNVIVAAGAKAGGLTGFSSKGIEFDNLPMISDPADTDFVSTTAPVDGVGLYHPSVTGIGESVRSARAPATVVSGLGVISGDEEIPPDQLPYYTHASGTSMSAPQVSGLVALIQQAFHQDDDSGRWLTPAQVKSVLQLSAHQMPGLKLFQQGYGLINAPDAVALAASLADSTTVDIDDTLAAAMATRNAQAAAERGGDVVAGYAWRRPTLDSVGGLAEHAVTIDVPATADRVKAIVGFPTTPQLNVASVDLYLFDAEGTEVGRATASSFSTGVQILDVTIADLAAPPAFGTWTLEARGDVSSSCWGASTRCGGVIDEPSETWLVASVIETGGGGGGGFTPTGSTTLYLSSDAPSESAPPALVKPGYAWDGTGPAGGDLTTAGPDNPRAGFAGYTHSHAPVVADPAVFTSPALASDLTIGDDLGVDVWLQSEGGLVGRGSISYAIAEISTTGERKIVWSGELVAPYNSGPDPVANHFDFDLPLPHTFAAGTRLEATLQFSAAVHAGLRLYYDSPAEPSALTFTTGTIS